MSKKLSLFAAIFLTLALCYGLFVAVPRAAIQPQRTALTTSPADVELRYESFEVSPADQSLKLAGWWIPAPDARATLVFIHGGGSSRDSDFFKSLDFYRALVDEGVSVAAIDLRNHGESGNDSSGLQFGRTEMYDALAAVHWARNKAATSPLFLMGISMGGATAIHAAHHGADIDGLILLDSLLDTDDTFIRGGTAQSNLPAALFVPSSWAARMFFGLPSGNDEALEKAARLQLPILLIQDPDDPVTRAVYARELAARNTHVTFWEAPPVDPAHPDIVWKGGWGSHVSAFALFPRQTVAQIINFMQAQGVSP